MPLRPALAAIHPRSPQPRAVRRVACPHCGHAFEISRRALSIRCPGCTRPLQFEDMRLTARMEGDVSTMGHVSLTPPSEMVGRLICGQFTNEGRFDGKAIVYGPIDLTSESLTTGELTGRSFAAGHGATFRGKLSITPNPKVSPVVQALAARPLRKAARRLTSSRNSSFRPIV